MLLVLFMVLLMFSGFFKMFLETFGNVSFGHGTGRIPSFFFLLFSGVFVR